MFEGYASIPGARLWYWDTGGDGPTVVLCHPASQCCQVWEHQRDAFVASGYRVIGYSRRGYFRSETGLEGHQESTVEDLDNLLILLRVEQTYLLGAAAGGITALGYTNQFPDKVRGLVLAGTIFAPDEDEWRAMHARLGIAELRGAASTEFLELGPSYRATDPEGVDRFAALARIAVAGKGDFKQSTGRSVTWESLEALKVPVLLLTGEADLYSPPPMQKMVAKHLQNHQLVSLAAIGHAAYWEAPEDFNQAVLAFLNDR
jgi:pimeloyl-ACP methyl ester carboxylesterase